MDVRYFTIVLFRLAFTLELVSADRPANSVVVGHDHHQSGALDLAKQAVVSGHGGVFAAPVPEKTPAKVDVRPEYQYPATSKVLEGHLNMVQKFKESEAPLNTLSNDVVKKSEEYGESLEKLHKFQDIHAEAVKAMRDFEAKQEEKKVKEVQEIMGATNKLVDIKEIKGEGKPDDPEVKNLAEVNIFEFKGRFHGNQAKYKDEEAVKTALAEALKKDKAKDPNSKYLFCINVETTLQKGSERTLDKERIQELERIIDTVVKGQGIDYAINSKTEFSKSREGTIIYKTYPKNAQKQECYPNDVQYIEDSNTVLYTGSMLLGESAINFNDKQ